MTRTSIAATLVTVSLAGAVAGIGTATGHHAAAHASCSADAQVPGGWWCTFPTSARTARVYVTAYEDGSARVVALDPDASTPRRVR